MCQEAERISGAKKAKSQIHLQAREKTERLTAAMLVRRHSIRSSGVGVFNKASEDLRAKEGSAGLGAIFECEQVEIVKDVDADEGAESYSDWERREEQLEQEDEQKMEAALWAAKKPTGPLQNKATSKIARLRWDASVNECFVSDFEIKGRWDKSLLSGGRAGCVSLSQKRQRRNNAAARINKTIMALSDEVDGLEKPDLTGNGSVVLRFGGL